MIALKPSKIVCVGRNYRAHAEELGNPMPPEPILFLKPPSSLISDGDTIVLPPLSSRGLTPTAALAVAVGVLLVVALGVWPLDALHLADSAAASLAQAAGDIISGQ